MTWAANINNPKKEKHSLVVVRPRMRVTGWELYTDSASPPLATYRVLMPHGFVTRCWGDYANDDGLYNSASLELQLLNTGSWFYDPLTKYLYYTGFEGSPGDANPDNFKPGIFGGATDFPGMTVEFELNFASQTFIGPRDPLNNNSQHVLWRGCLEQSPLAQSGSRQNIYGFFPVAQSSLGIKNGDGWMNEFLYAATFKFAVCKAYIMANADLREAMALGDIKQIFTGYTDGMTVQGFDVNLRCVDFLSFFDREVSLRKMDDIDFGTYDPDSRPFLAQKLWYMRRIFGKVTNHRPINIGFDYTPGTSVNRMWLTHQADEAIGSVLGSRVFLDDGTLTYSIDTGGANSATRTYTTVPPKVMVGDGVIIKRSGTDRYAQVTAVGANYFDHDSISGSAAGGDTVTRPFVALVTITNADGEKANFLPGRDYDLLIDDTEANRLRGFTLHNNVEAAMSGAPFDPVSWDVDCTVYGRKGLDQYQDLSDVGDLSDHGGIMANAAAVIYRLLIDAGFPRDEISDEIFQTIDDDALSVGFAIPFNKEETKLPTYNELLGPILQSNLYKLFVAEDSTGIVIGISETKPFETSGDFDATELQHAGMDFEHDYDQLYSEVELSYNRAELFNADVRAEFEIETAESVVAKNLHFIDAKFELETKLYAEAEAETLARRMAFILGERRGYWKFDFELAFVNRTNLGTAYRVYRQQMPGFPYVENTQRSIELSVTEVNKSSNGVSITLEDQKGIQDNSGDW